MFGTAHLLCCLGFGFVLLVLRTSGEVRGCCHGGRISAIVRSRNVGVFVSVPVHVQLSVRVIIILREEKKQEIKISPSVFKSVYITLLLT